MLMHVFGLSRWPLHCAPQGHCDAPNWRSSSSRQGSTSRRLLHARQLLCLLLMEHGWGGDWASHRLAQDFVVSLHAYDGDKVVGACPTDAIVPLWYRYKRDLGTALCRNLGTLCRAENLPVSRLRTGLAVLMPGRVDPDRLVQAAEMALESYPMLGARWDLHFNNCAQAPCHLWSCPDRSCSG